MLDYRDLSDEDVRMIRGIDRSESIDGVYWVRDGELELVFAAQDAPGWGSADIVAYVTRIETLLSAGGRAIGAWSKGRLVGFASLDFAGVGGDPTLVLLDMLYVSRESRGRGIGRELTQRIGAIASSRGATDLYISATPTRATVDAYLSMGAVLIDEPDAALFEREPEDIHLVLSLAGLRPGP